MAIKEIINLKYRYCYNLDNANVSEFVDLFSDDITFRVPNYGSGEGIEDVEEFITKIASKDLPLLVHMAFNPIIDISEKMAKGDWYYIVIIVNEENEKIFGQGRWEDEYRYVDGSWKISSLMATRQFTAKFSN